MKAKNVAKSIDVIIGGLEDLKKELLEADVETTEEAVEAEAPKTRKTSKKSEPVSDNKVSKKTKATTKAAKVEEEDEDDGDTDYASMKYNDLKKLAVERGMKSPNVSKDELIAFLSGEDVDDEEEDVESEAVENETDEEDLTDTVTKLLDGVDTEDIAGFLTENGISAKGKRPSLIAKIVTAIEDGDLSLEDLEVEDDEEEEVEEAPKKTSKKSATPKSKKSAKVEEPEDDDDEEDEDDEEESEDAGFGYVCDYDAEMFINEETDNELLARVTPERFEAAKKYAAGVEKDLKKKTKKAELVKELEEFFGDEFNAKKDDILEVAVTKFLLMTDDDGETHELEDPYEINEIACCCGQQLTETKDGYVCDICGNEYDEE